MKFISWKIKKTSKLISKIKFQFKYWNEPENKFKTKVYEIACNLVKPLYIQWVLFVRYVTFITWILSHILMRFLLKLVSWLLKWPVKSQSQSPTIFFPLLRDTTRTTMTILHPGYASLSLKQGLCSNRRVGLPVEKFTNTNEKMNYSLSRENSPLLSLFIVLF